MTTLRKQDPIWWDFHRHQGPVPAFIDNERTEQAGWVSTVNEKTGIALITVLNEQRHPVAILTNVETIRERIIP